MNYFIDNIAIFLLAYIIGSLPSGYWIARLNGINDIRNYGSGNIGATNVGRILGIKFFIIVFLIDGLKAFIFLKFLLDCNYSLFIVTFAAACVLIGNGASIFLRFKGGKGIATGFGILLAIEPSILGIAALVWFIFFGLFQQVGVASVFSLLILPIIALCIHISFYSLLLIIFISLWCVVAHRTNISIFCAQSIRKIKLLS